jgi:tetratricopeptide (TPR) repeat protein
VETTPRKEAQRPDDFMTLVLRGWDFVVKHAAQVALAGGGAFAVVAAGIVWQHLADRGRGDATALLGLALEQQQKPIVAAVADGGVEVDNFRSAEERCASVLGRLDKLDQSHPGSPAAAAASILRAGCLLDAGRSEEAQKAYRAYLEESPSDDPIRPFAYEGLGYALERGGKFQDALAEFRRMAFEEASPYRDRAQWHEARMLERLGKAKEAVAAYRAILEKFPATTMRDEIAARIAALDR